ncbi:MAG: glycosyltransferase family 4 protein [Williamsia sp.]|nr:glycosyltransferase family 4 protein [Williamsia sp.]
MKILYDHQIFDFQQFGGVSRYFFELMAHFERDASVEWDLPLLYTDNEYLKKIPRFADSLLPRSKKGDPYKNFLGGTEFRGKRILYRVKNKVLPPPASINETAINKAKAIRKIQEGDFDLFHPTYYDDYFLEYIGEKPFVVTVYDMIHQIFPEYGLYEKLDKNKDLLDRASKIISISESTKTDLVNMFNIDEKKIAVTHLASSLEAEGEDVSASFKEKLPAKYLLYVGGRGAYKNFLFFAQVVAAVVEKEKDLAVVCTGAPFDERERYLFNKTGITGRMHHTYVTDAELRHLYRNAEALAFPSMYEGFGLPILEAFSCGCPVLVSNTSSLIEIGEEAATYFEPKNPGSMINAIRKVINDHEHRQQKIDLGYQQVKKFSWQKTAHETKRVYQQVLSDLHLRNQVSANI